MTAGGSFICRDGIIHGTLCGHVNTNIWTEFFHKMLVSKTVHRTKALLVDLRQARVPLGVFEIYELPPILERVGINGQNRMAFLFQELSYDLDFYETVLCNQGFTAQLFVDFEQAILWLTGERIPSKIN